MHRPKLVTTFENINNTSKVGSEPFSNSSMVKPDLLLGNKYPELESDILEFKSNYNKQCLYNYKKTINAFMNNRGGRLIFGISNDSYIKGISLNETLIDNCKLFLDSLYGNETYPQFIGELSTEIIYLTSKLGLMIWHVKQPSLNDLQNLQSKKNIKQNITYYLSNGRAYIRKNASNVEKDFCALVQHSELSVAKKEVDLLTGKNKLLTTELLSVQNEYNKFKLDNIAIHNKLTEKVQQQKLQIVSLEKQMDIQNNNILCTVQEKNIVIDILHTERLYKKSNELVKSYKDRNTKNLTNFWHKLPLLSWLLYW